MCSGSLGAYRSRVQRLVTLAVRLRLWAISEILCNECNNLLCICIQGNISVICMNFEIYSYGCKKYGESETSSAKPKRTEPKLVMTTIAFSKFSYGAQKRLLKPVDRDLIDAFQMARKENDLGLMYGLPYKYICFALSKCNPTHFFKPAKIA